MKKYKGIIILIVFIVSMTLTSCSNMRLGTNVGVGVTFGSNGPQVTPHASIGLNSGGYHY
jgi:predicted small secreted protein